MQLRLKLCKINHSSESNQDLIKQRHRVTRCMLGIMQVRWRGHDAEQLLDDMGPGILGFKDAVDSCVHLTRLGAAIRCG